MRKTFAKLLLFVLAFATLLTGCAGEYVQGIRPSHSTGHQTVPGSTAPEDENPFTVRLAYTDPDTGRVQYYIPTAENPITVLWSDGFSVHEAKLDADGVARMGGLDGDYRVTLTNLPDGFYYNPNDEAHLVDNNNRHCTIQLQRVIETIGRGLDPYNPIKIKQTGVYCIEVKSAEQKTYFRYSPRKSGTYTVESWMDVVANEINPVCDYHGANVFYADNVVSTHDDGGPENSYTKNFVMNVEIADEQLPDNPDDFGFTFGVYATQKSGKYPIKIYIAVTFNGEFELEHASGNIMCPQENLQALVNKLSGLDNAGNPISGAPNLFEPSGSWHWAERPDGTTMVFEGDDYRMNPATGVYHKYDAKKYASNNGYGPVLFAKISEPTRFLTDKGGNPIGIDRVEYQGNKALTVDNGERNYKMFIEGWSYLNYTDMVVPGMGKGPYFCSLYCPCRLEKTCTSAQMGLENGTCETGCTKCDIGCRKLPKEAIGALGYSDVCNSDGAFPVTEELKEFLQLMSISQLYFMDGEGWVETNSGIFATEDDQWLWACGYYE